MGWQDPNKGFLGAVNYSARFGFPLSRHEIWFWQIGTNLPQKSLKNIRYSLPNPVNRSERRKNSLAKMAFLQRYLAIITRNPFVSACFITGSLAVENCLPDDDIDLMIISRPHCLWLARAWNIVVLGWYRLRRPSGLSVHSSPKVSNKFCDNLYLDITNLQVFPHNLYIAHEVLQAKPVFDPAGIARIFLKENSWVSRYLPVAYQQTLRSLPNRNRPVRLPVLVHFVFRFLNYLFFLLQYAYMSPKITNERIFLTQAYFHPRGVYDILQTHGKGN